MSTYVLLKGAFILAYSLTFGGVAYFRCGKEADEEWNDSPGEGSKPRYQPFIAGNLLPIFFLTVLLLGLAISGAEMTGRFLLKMCVDIFLPLSIYYALLMCLLPSLRKRINARTCALLWVMPNYLYIVEMTPIQKAEPLLVVSAPEMLVRGLAVIWLAGAAVFLLWKIISHMAFRRALLYHSAPVYQADILTVWNQELENAGISREKWKGKLLQSADVSTPFTIGLFRRSLCVVLPKRTYTQEELALIFRHELVHIGRQDGWSKFFMAFCTAMCWFNPLMWVAMRKCADDLELSCDETVLLAADDQERKRYAELLLSSAGESRGFTTCLSAAASTMRYRLKSVMKPAKHRSGAILVSVIFFILCMSCGTVALAYGEDTGEMIIFDGRGQAEYSFSSAFISEGYGTEEYTCTDEKALYEYFAGLKLQRLTGEYGGSTYGRDDRELTCSYNVTGPGGPLFIALTDHQLEVTHLHRDTYSSVYYLPEGADWEYLDGLLERSDG